jgi:ribosomal protein L29
MTKHATPAELRKMSPEELRKEITSKRSEIAKAKIGVRMGSHKDTATVRRDRKELARMLTVMNANPAEKSASTLKKSKKASKVPASSSSK